MVFGKEALEVEGVTKHVQIKQGGEMKMKKNNSFLMFIKLNI